MTARNVFILTQTFWVLLPVFIAKITDHEVRHGDIVPSACEALPHVDRPQP